MSFPVDVTATNATSTSVVHVPATVLTNLLKSSSKSIYQYTVHVSVLLIYCVAGSRRLAVVSLVYNNLQELMPPTTKRKKNTTSQSISELR